jgi:hypothetical protein
MDVFVSVGSTFNEAQDRFVDGLIELLREHDLQPRILNRLDWLAAKPLLSVDELMDRCDGVLVVAFERWFLGDAVEKRNSPNQRVVKGKCMPTPWNQIEPAMAYVKGLPIFVLAEHGLLAEGLLEEGHDWYVQSLPLDPGALRSPEVIGRIKDWKQRMEKARAAREGRESDQHPQRDPSTLTIRQLLGDLRPAQLWGLGTALLGALGTAFILGRQLAP